MLLIDGEPVSTSEGRNDECSGIDMSSLKMLERRCAQNDAGNQKEAVFTLGFVGDIVKKWNVIKDLKEQQGYFSQRRREAFRARKPYRPRKFWLSQNTFSVYFIQRRVIIAEQEPGFGLETQSVSTGSWRI